MIRLSLPRRAGLSIAAQIVCLVFAGVVAVQLMVMAALWVTRSPPPRDNPMAQIDRFIEFVRLLDRLPASSRQDLSVLIGETYPALQLSYEPRSDAAPKFTSSSTPDMMHDRLQELLAPSIRVQELDAGAAAPGRRHFVVSLSDGSRVAGVLSNPGDPPGYLGPWAILLMTLVFVATVSAALIGWAARSLVAPLAQLSASADTFALDRPHALLDETGPVEIRKTVRALNRMQARIHTLMGDRTRMLAAVSHDLRTPVTRMRLRAEFITDEETRGALLRDLSQIDQLTEAALSHLRDEQAKPEKALIDLATLAQAAVDDSADVGHDVRYEGPDHLVVNGSARDLRRALDNVLDNACKHGAPPTLLRLRDDGTQALIEISDHGPGVSAADQPRLLEAFARGTDALPAGFGLGLAIARDITRSAGGEVQLLERSDGQSGLVVRLAIPRGSGTASG